MIRVRSPAVAGMFYPADAQILQQEIEDLLRHASAKSAIPKAIIAPHAGYRFSGAVAASVYAQLKPLREKIKRVVLLGPCHRVPVRGLAAPEDEQFETPLGRIEIDQAALEAVEDLPQVIHSRMAHLQEHSLEVQLPFLQSVLNDFKLVPFVVGQASPEDVAQVLERLWGGEETLIVISSDLSHFLDYPTAKEVDQHTSDAIVHLQPQIEPEQACGCFSVNGLLEVARRKQLQSEMLDLRNSGDTAGPRDQVVGYGAYVFH